MPHRIVYTQQARNHIGAIYDYIAVAGSPEIARGFTDGIVSRIDALADFPRIGTPRDNLQPGLRTLPYRRRVTITFSVEEAVVYVLGIYYGGQDFEALLRNDAP